MSALRVYIGYSTGEVTFFSELSKHLSISGATVLARGMVPPGEDEETFAARILSTADLFLPLISAEYLTSTQGQQEIGSTSNRTIPILARPCNLSGTPLEKLQRLPRSGRDVASIRNRAAAWAEVAAEILAFARLQAAALPEAESRLPAMEQFGTEPQHSSMLASLPSAQAVTARVRMAVDSLSMDQPSSRSQSPAAKQQKRSLGLNWLMLTLALVITLSISVFAWNINLRSRSFELISLRPEDCHNAKFILRDKNNKSIVLPILLRDAEQFGACNITHTTQTEAALTEAVARYVGLTDYNRYAFVSADGNCDVRVFYIFDKQTGKIYHRTIQNNCQLFNLSEGPEQLAVNVAKYMHLP